MRHVSVTVTVSVFFVPLPVNVLMVCQVAGAVVAAGVVPVAGVLPLACVACGWGGVLVAPWLAARMPTQPSMASANTPRTIHSQIRRFLRGGPGGYKGCPG